MLTCPPAIWELAEFLRSRFSSTSSLLPRQSSYPAAPEKQIVRTSCAPASASSGKYKHAFLATILFLVTIL
jgi:hypothetical protein